MQPLCINNKAINLKYQTGVSSLTIFSLPQSVFLVLPNCTLYFINVSSDKIYFASITIALTLITSNFLTFSLPKFVGVKGNEGVRYKSDELWTIRNVKRHNIILS